MPDLRALCLRGAQTVKPVLRSLQQRSYSKGANSMFKSATPRKKVGDSPKGSFAKFKRGGGPSCATAKTPNRQDLLKMSDQVLGTHNTPLTSDNGNAPSWNAPFLQFLDNLDAALPSGARPSPMETSTNAEVCVGR